MNYNLQQKQAIESINGPILIIAGPGTGKTFTLVERVKYMVEVKKINPSSILISTFTNKAAFELVDRLSLNFSQAGLKADVNDMVVGNFHSICRQIINKYLDKTYLRKGYAQIDELGQKYMVERNLRKFTEIKDFSQVISKKGQVNEIVNLVNKIREEGILRRTSDDRVVQIGFEILKTYEELLNFYNVIDFAGILFTCYKLLANHKDIREKIRSTINYIMIDEYQDTNTIQEKIVFLMLNENKNICVVGDDDQSLYRFRGASVKNILNFHEKIDDVKVIKLMQNYRSEDSIIKFYSSYLQEIVDDNPKLRKFRHKKILYSDQIGQESGVKKLISNNQQQWMDQILKTIIGLKKYGKINDYNEVALLFSSVVRPEVSKLFTYLRKNGIDIYTPTIKTLLSRKEVHYMIGAVYHLYEDQIKKHVVSKTPDTYEFLENYRNEFYKKALKDSEILNFLDRMRSFINDDENPLSLYDIYYRLFAYDPFYSLMKNASSAKNMSRFLELIEVFSQINRIYYIDQKNMKEFTNLFFYQFISFIRGQKNISEFEEDTKIPEGGSISAMTIHAAKGMEYPVVILGSLWDKPFNSKYKSNVDKLMDILLEEEGLDKDYEPTEYIEDLDFARKYYTAFSRAKELLVFAGYDNQISDYMKKIIYKKNEDGIDLVSNLSVKDLTIEKGPIKDIKIKHSYSYTGDIVAYNRNSMEYLYKRKLKFNEPKTKAIHYGSIVHESIEYINKQIIANTIDGLDVSKIVHEIARQKYLQGAIMISKKDVDNAIGEVDSYLKNIEKFGELKDSELEIIYTNQDYALNGNVDLIFEKDGNTHIIDFKTGLPPNLKDDEHTIENYKNQIRLYAYLYKATKNQAIESISLYFTDQRAEPSLYTYKIEDEDLDVIFKLIDETIKNIEAEKFSFKESDEDTSGLLKFFMTKYRSEIGPNTTN